MTKTLSISSLLSIVLFFAPQWALAVTPTEAEMAKMRKWVATKFGDIAGGTAKANSSSLFSFKFDGQSSRKFVKDWKYESAKRVLDVNRTEITQTFTDPKTLLEVRCVAVVYSDFPTVEWTVYFKNNGTSDTPILSEILPIDMQFACSGDKLALHHWSHDGPDDLQKRTAKFTPNEPKRFAPFGGRPTGTCMPNYNIELDGNNGAIVVLGWPGQWASEFAWDGKDKLRVRGGQELTHFKLLPGEAVRTPLVAVEFYNGDWMRGQNIWRQWMLAHNLPRPGGKPVRPMVATGNADVFAYFAVTEANQKEFIDIYRKSGLKFDVWWMDLGWFAMNMNTLVYSALFDTDPARFPKGLLPVSNYVHEKGLKLMCWFEPEHHYPGPENWLCKNKPQWLLKAPPGHEAEINQGLPLKDRMILNLGNSEALDWCVKNTLRVMDELKIDYYRHDFNIEPLLFWRGNDAPDRQGITEIRFVTGFLEYYDALLKNKPGLLIDNCASGGQRNDLETMRRSVPLWRSDSAWDPDTMQSQTCGIAFWLPYYGTGVTRSDAYAVRSIMCPSTLISFDARKVEMDVGQVARIMNNDWREIVAPNYFGDFYTLLPVSLAKDIWIAWQFDRPAEGKGVVQAFRRAECSKDSVTVKLRGLENDAVYEVKNIDTGAAAESSGRELSEIGLTITLKSKPDAAIIHYRKKQ